MIRLVQDFAQYYVANCGLSVRGIQHLSQSMPCAVTPNKKGSRSEASVAGGLVTYHIARAISLESTISCYPVRRISNWDRANRSERLQLLSIAPMFCRGDRDGTALLKRIWTSCTKDERQEVYGVTAFTKFARQLQIKSRFQPPPPNAQTAKQYEPGAAADGSRSFTLGPNENKHDS